MNRRLKLLILVLLLAVLCLSAAIVSFRFSFPAAEQPEQESQPSGKGSAISLFEGTNGLWGAVNANGRVLIEPTWFYLRSMSDSVLIARRSSGKTAEFGLIRTNGEQLVPFIYHSIIPVAATDSDLWIAAFTENGKQRFHLYHADGTRWSDTPWDSYSYNDGVISLSSGTNRRRGALKNRRIEWIEWETDYPIGLHTMTAAFDEAELKRLPSAETLSDIGEAAADYLRYLFITRQHPEESLVAEENRAGILVDYRYLSCRFLSAEISRIKECETEGLPSYLVQIQVKYQATDENDVITDTVRTAMMLTLTRSTNGALVYSSFNDSQMDAAGAF